jgi:hypothetical protein
MIQETGLPNGSYRKALHLLLHRRRREYTAQDRKGQARDKGGASPGRKPGEDSSATLTPGGWGYICRFAVWQTRDHAAARSLGKYNPMRPYAASTSREGSFGTDEGECLLHKRAGLHARSEYFMLIKNTHQRRYLGPVSRLRQSVNECAPTKRVYRERKVPLRVQQLRLLRLSPGDCRS